jgi:hypothetical protein
MKNSNFSRRFTVQMSVQGTTCSVKNVIVERLTEKREREYEWIYAIQSYHLDDILDLKIGENIFFQPDRDDNKSKGIITRIF